MKLPITTIIPALLIFSTTITSFVIYKKNVNSADNDIRNYALQELKIDITRLQNILYNLLTEDNISDARVNLSVAAMNPAMQALILADEKNNIIAANRYIWINHAANKVVDFDDKIAFSIKQKNKPLIYFDKNKNKNHILKGYYPVVLQLISEDNVSRKKLGVLYAEVNIRNKLLVAKNKAFNQSLYFSGAMLLAVLLVSIVLHLLVSRRLNTLALASNSIALGDFDTNINIKGNDEISHLADSFNKMTHRIKKAFASREKAELELIDLNETLEKRINERTQLLAQAQDIAKIGSWVWDVLENTLYWSDRAFLIFGKEKDDFNPAMDDFFSLIYPEDIPTIKSAIDNTFISNEKYTIEYRLVCPDGGFRWVREEAVAEVDNNGHRLKLIAVIQDITSEKNEKEEKEKLEREIQQMQKMESLGQLTGGIAHDFNNMLAIIMGYTELSVTVANKLEDKKLIKYLEQVNMGSQRAKELVMQMLVFSRTSEASVDKENLLVIKSLNEIGLMLKPLLSSSIILNIINSDNALVIHADAVVLNQILMNLCINAKDSMVDDQGNIDIEASQVELNKEVCSSCFNLISGHFIQIEVKDNGAGISETQLNKIFEPFYTTKEVGKGSGMGLSMVHGLMHKHQGHLVVDSTEGIGSSFKLLFPVIQEGSAKNLIKDEPRIQEEVVNTQGRVLIVDDEVAIAGFLKEYLEDKGYQVQVINSSKEALEYFLKHYDVINLVITDYTMPDMTGVQLASEMLICSPDMPILLCSGYSQQINKEKALSLNLKGYIEKPINTTVLLEEIKAHIKN